VTTDAPSYSAPPKDTELNLTPIRREVLDILSRAAHPLAAYTILEQLQHGAKKPPTVYRALDYLIAHGSVHRLESLNAYVLCRSSHAAAAHHAGFLICRQCQCVCELEDITALEQLVTKYGQNAGFTQLHGMIEIRGLCAPCAETMGSL
jgi:Fur family transcriptional regulator, zinc uptake regulator